MWIKLRVWGRAYWIDWMSIHVLMNGLFSQISWRFMLSLLPFIQNSINFLTDLSDSSYFADTHRDDAGDRLRLGWNSIARRVEKRRFNQHSFACSSRHGLGRCQPFSDLGTSMISVRPKFFSQVTSLIFTVGISFLFVSNWHAWWSDHVIRQCQDYRVYSHFLCNFDILYVLLLIWNTTYHISLVAVYYVSTAQQLPVWLSVTYRF